MEPNEEWPSTTTPKGKKHMIGGDNGCFMRWTTIVTGVCVGPVEKTDSYGNKYCHHHHRVMLTERERAK